MTQVFASKLEAFLESNLDLISWETLEPLWKGKIQASISGDIPPSYFLSPYTQDSLASIIQCAAENRSTVLTCGSGSKLNWGGAVKNPQLVISSQHLNRIIDYAVDDLTVTVEAGVKIADLQAILQQNKQFLPLDPAYPDSATIGGIVATADAGSWRQRYGGVRDMVLGLSFVRADGKIAKAGGRVVKNVAGYDLMKLFTGSYGTLAMISQVTLRLYPFPGVSATLVLTGDSNAIEMATQTILKSSLTPTAAEILSASLLNHLELGEGMGLMIRFQSIPESVREQSSQVKNLAQQLGLQVSLFEGESEINLWQRLPKIMVIPQTSSAITCKIGVTSNRAVKFLHQLDEITANQGLGMINIGSGLGKLQLEGENLLSQVKKLRSLSENYQGFLTILEAPVTFKQQLEPWGYRGNALEIMQKIKQQFDPENILNPGRFVI